MRWAGGPKKDQIRDTVADRLRHLEVTISLSGEVGRAA